MNTPLSVATIAVTGILVAGTVATVTASADPPAMRQLDHETLTIDEPFQGGTGSYIDLGTKDIGPGDMFLGTGVPALSHATGKRIGTFDSAETIVSGAHNGIVDQTTTLRLRDGLIMFGGVVRHDDKPLRSAVIGGTGRYAQARGQLTELREDTGRKVTVLRLDLYR
jgi:hypothetical protein